MDYIKYQRLKNDCNAAIANDNLELCLEHLVNNIDPLEAEIYKACLALQGRLSALTTDKNSGMHTYDEVTRSKNSIRESILLQIEKVITEKKVSFHNSINYKILVIACTNNEITWNRLFSKADFTHCEIMKYNDPTPDGYKSPDIIIFDDLGKDCEGRNFSEMLRLSKEMPDANLLYVGGYNPFTDSSAYKEIFDRFANANSFVTVHGRLRELLEYRKYYRPGLNE
jgi:hypothetical protein